MLHNVNIISPIFTPIVTSNFTKMFPANITMVRPRSIVDKLNRLSLINHKNVASSRYNLYSDFSRTQPHNRSLSDYERITTRESDGGAYFGREKSFPNPRGI